MSPERWQEIKTILADAREQPAEDRRAWLERACAGDPTLLSEVEAYLAYEDRLEGFIDQPVLDVTGTLDAANASPMPREDAGTRAAGRRIGRYRLVRMLAEGGMGAVYLAERIEDFEQRVALKLVRRGLATPEMIRRFHDERQILARLEHPNIARLLDGGTTEDGDPYFAMELIDGEPIDRYCDRHRLSTRQRLEIFLPVCSALALAHQNLIIHRDLKPGNVLVDAAGIPKLLDFGIAKLLEPGTGVEGVDGVDGAAALTRNRAMTPHYSSPEQLRGEAVGTASDVYSLGVVLYRVLTGHLPCRLDSRDPVAAMVAVCEEEPLVPSAVVQRREEITHSGGEVEHRTPETVSRVRDGDAATLRRRLSGDVDAIVAKALRKEPHRRYPSIEQLAADLRRHLDGLPVLARQGSFAYRAGKFARRHRLGLASVAAMALLAVAFTVALVRQLHETERSRDRAQAIASFMIELFQSAAPDRLAGEEPTVRDLLDRGRAKLESALEQEPEVRSTLQLKLGEVYTKLGDYARARELLEASIESLRRQHEEPHPDLATALGDLAAVHFHAGDLETAEALFRDSLALRRRLGQGEDLIKPMNNLATILMARREFAEAERIYRESLALRRAAVAARPADDVARRNLATNLRSLAMALHGRGDYDVAEPLLRESLALRRALYGPNSPVVATAVLSLGRLEHARGRLEDAETLIARGLEVRARELGEAHLHTALARRDLAAVKLDRGRAGEAEALLLTALETLGSLRPAGDPDVVETERLLAAARGDRAGGTGDGTAGGAR